MLNVNKYPEFRSIRLDSIIPDLKQLIEFQLEHGMNKKKKSANLVRITYKNSSLESSTTRRKASKAKEAAYRGIDESRSHCLSPFVAIYPASRLIETVIKRVKSDRGAIPEDRAFGN